MFTKRRTIIGLLGAGVSASWVPRSAKPLKILIVGAGIAGLSAARLLADGGHIVTILEGRQRIGGRINTSMQWPDAPIDLGASWIHGVSGNPVSDLARRAGAATVVTSYENSLEHVATDIRARGIHGVDDRWAAQLVERAVRAAADLDADISVRAAVDRISPPERRDPAQRAQLEFYLSANYEQEFAGTVSQLSAWTVDDIKEFPGEDALFPGGYGQLTGFLSKGLDIRLGAQVTGIDVRDSVTLAQCADGRKFSADRLVVTVPLGVLKQRGIRFTPNLSPRKLAAIDRLGMGLLNKHFLRFDRLHWPAHYDWHEYLKDAPSAWSQWVSMARINSLPVLLGFAAGDAAHALEKSNERDVVAEAMSAVRGMFGTSVPDPVGWQLTRWSSDPFSFGSYSYSAVGSTPNDREALAAAEASGLIRFAGEACHRDYPGTVHGALLSGQGAARAILAAA